MLLHLLRSSRGTFLRSPCCSDSVCFLRDFCRVDKVAGRRTPDPFMSLDTRTRCDAAFSDPAGCNLPYPFPPTASDPHSPSEASSLSFSISVLDAGRKNNEDNGYCSRHLCGTRLRAWPRICSDANLVTAC